MKVITILVFFILFLYSNETSNNILNSIPKDSLNYSLGKIWLKKIDSLKLQTPVINLNPKNEREYVNSFYQLISFLKREHILKKDIITLKEKISFLSTQNDPISKLQLIYYKKLLDIEIKELDFIKTHFALYEEKLFYKLKDINFDVKRIETNINIWRDRIDSLSKLTIHLHSELKNNQSDSQIELTQYKLNELLKKRKELYKNLLKEEISLWLFYIKLRSKKAFEIGNLIERDSKIVDENFYMALKKVMRDFYKFSFGSRVIFYSTQKEIEFLIEKILYILNYPLFKIGGNVITPLNFAIFILIVIVGWFIGRYYKKFIYKIRHQYKLSYATSTLLANIGYYLIIIISFLVALKSVGLDLSSFALVAGALSVGIGFGLQNIVSNFVSGIILMFEKTIKVGDYIQISEDTRGEVIDISMRSTIIRTNDNINLIIPNQSFIQNEVINWTLGDDIVRFRVPFGVAYGSDIDKVERVILDALEKSNLQYVKKHSLYKVTPKVIFTQMGDSSLDFELFVWVKGEYARRPRITRSEFLKVIYKALNRANIEIPFPQRDLHLRDSVPIEVIVKKEN